MDVQGKKAALIVALAGFRDEEYLEPRQVLVKAGIGVTTVSTGPGTARGKLGAKAAVDRLIEDLHVSDYEAILFIGGPGAADYFNHPRALAVANDAVAAGKVLGAICIAPGTLARAGVLKGKRATCFPSEEPSLKKAGAVYTGQDVEVDGRIVTANGPHAARAFGQAVVRLLT
ncbi:MAG: DJ-1/PfpI family protein [Acidobacteria bacterium]|nr:DJ-1/PfpI family protein [Acidobacteriota bacterium]